MESKSSVMIEEEKMHGGLDKNNIIVGGGGGEKKGEVEEGEVALPGFRFHPTDEELVGFYLRRKVDKKPLSIEIIRQIDIYKYDPWDLPKVSTVGDKEWYFFCLRGRKYRNSIRPNRVTGSGFWKATGIDRPIHPAAGDHSECIGLKKSLVYYRGSAGKGTKTDWMMHEFRLPSNNKNGTNSPSNQEAEIWTICRILKRNVTYKKYAQVCKQIPADHTSSKPSSSFESESGVTLATNYIEGTNQLSAGQWNPISQSPLTSFNSQVPNPSTNEFYGEANWDELGRIVEYVVDPALIYECT